VELVNEFHAIRYEPGLLRVIDQTRLPADEIWLELRDAEAVAEAIRSLRVRGAPMIGIAAAYGIAAVAHNRGDIAWAASLILSARPTAVNLAHAVERVLAAPGEEERIANEIYQFEIDACEAMGKHGATLLPDDARVMTYCNTGHLATGGIGTALGVIRKARPRHVWVPETRPLLQGARLTAWELAKLGLPFSVIADAATGSVFARGDVDAVVVGADRIAANGDTANKVGTYVLAVLAARHDVPFYVVAPSSTIDPLTPSGHGIPIEERAPSEVSAFPSHNPAFDVTPAGLITAIVTETGVRRSPYRFG
jgi:methylthioribose-1-phosphate isomerase